MESPNREFPEFENPGFALKEYVCLGAFAEKECPWLGQLREVDPVAGGRLEPKEFLALDGFAAKERPWLGQLLEADAAVGGRLELKE